MCNDQAAQLITIINYNLFLEAMRSNQGLYDEMSNPKPGDMVMETTTIHKASRIHGECIGTLVATGMAPYYASRKEARGAGVEDDEPIPAREVWDIQLDFQDGRPFRWENADFIKVMTEIRDLPDLTHLLKPGVVARWASEA